MKTVESSGFSRELMAELQDAAEKLAKGIRDTDAAKKAAERMDRMREENRKIFGIQDIGVSH
jgi:hypothetical protein